MLPAIDVHKRRHGASTHVHATAPKRGCRVSLNQVRSTLLWFFVLQLRIYETCVKLTINATTRIAVTIAGEQ